MIVFQHAPQLAPTRNSSQAENHPLGLMHTPRNMLFAACRPSMLPFICILKCLLHDRRWTRLSRRNWNQKTRKTWSNKRQVYRPIPSPLSSPPPVTIGPVRAAKWFIGVVRTADLHNVDYRLVLCLARSWFQYPFKTNVGEPTN